MRLKLPIALYTLKNRSLTPAAQIFIEQARLVAAEMRKEK
jgi:hypothetical protein